MGRRGVSVMAARAIYVQGRRVFHRMGRRTQTVNVCTAENQQGIYERVFRLDSRVPITAEQIGAKASLDQLSSWLLEAGATPEGSRTLDDAPGRVLGRSFDAGPGSA